MYHEGIQASINISASFLKHTSATYCLKFKKILRDNGTEFQHTTWPVKKLFGLKHEPVPWDESEEYDFNHAKRGSAMVFNMQLVKSDKGGLASRLGSSIDAERVTETFKRLGFDIGYFENQSKDQIMDIMIKEARKDHSNEDCFACVILTHGSSHYRRKLIEQSHSREDMIMAADTPFLTSDILKLFQDNKCKTLKGKPKLFFIQACRGDNFDKGASLNVGDEVDARPENSLEYNPCPIFKDFLVMYASPPVYYAFRDIIKGSWFIQALCRSLSSAEVQNKTLHQLLTSVIRIVTTEHQAQAPQYLGNKQTPCFMSMLVKDVYFRSKIKSLRM